MFFQLTGYIFFSGVASWLAIYCLLKLGLGKAKSSQLQHHHTHTATIPRIGGVGVMIGLLVAYAICFFQIDTEGGEPLVYLTVIGGACAAFLLGLVDDFYPLGARVKLFLQILIAVGVYQCGLSISRMTLPFTSFTIELGSIGLFLTILWFVSIMNLINLIDGLDGLAGGIGLMLMVLLAYLGVQQNLSFSSLLAFGMIGAILGFLLHNFPPAKCYMGDSGAYLIGFMIAALAVMNSQKGAVMGAMIGPALALALPILDVVFALFRRGVQGLPLFRPDRGHIHHLLVRMGFSQRKAVLALYGISLLALLGGLAALIESGRHLPIFLGFAFVVILFVLHGQNISTNGLLFFLADSLQSRRDIRNALHLKDWLIAEAERADKIIHLWSDYKFFLKKIGICRAELTISKEMREFYIPHTPSQDSEDLWTEIREIQQKPQRVSLKLYGEKESLSKEQFLLLVDIASEAWNKAGQKWQAVNDCPAAFDAIAIDPDNYYDQKSRNLYRPTY